MFREAILTPNGTEAIALLLRYIALVCDHRYEEFREKLHQQLPEAEQAVMTIAEELRQEGRQEERIEMLERLLLRRFKQIPPEYVARLGTVTEVDLDHCIDRILGAQTIAEVFDEPRD